MSKGCICADIDIAQDKVKEFAKEHKCSAVLRKIDYNSGCEYQVDKATEFDLRCYASGSTSILATCMYNCAKNGDNVRLVDRKEVAKSLVGIIN